VWEPEGRSPIFYVWQLNAADPLLGASDGARFARSITLLTPFAHNLLSCRQFAQSSLRALTLQLGTKNTPVRYELNRSDEEFFLRSAFMGSTTDKITGYANQVAGSVKQGVGKAVGSEELEVKGAVQDLKGKAQVAVGDVKEAVKDGANKAADEINRKL
jgi:uncharacterized protein YjbJ (UPF0337 family)